MQVPLTQGYFATIDECDADRVLAFKWHVLVVPNSDIRYAMRTVNKKSVLMHRFILDLGRESHTDHIDGNGLNNTRANLRQCSHAENMRNRRLNKNSTSGVKGVAFKLDGSKRYGSWCAQVSSNGVMFRKRFKTMEAAEQWALAKRTELHGEFANHR